MYGIGVVVASHYVTRLVDRTGSTEGVLFWGAALSGVGLIVLGFVASTDMADARLGTVIVVCSVLLIGIAHGGINAPVITHIAQSELAGRIGANPATTAYRFLERVGHVAGPLLLGQLFLFWGQSPNILAWVGFAVTTLGFAFLIGNISSSNSAARTEPAQ
jgi:hypothetical protein